MEKTAAKMDFGLSSLGDLCFHSLNYHCFRLRHEGAPPVRRCFCSCFIPYSLTEPAPHRVTPDPPCHPRVGMGSHTALPSGGSQKAFIQPPWAGVWAAWEREEFMAIFCFLPWRAMRLKDISKCLFPECCDKMKPALTGTCSLFPSWSLICHCWRLEDLNGSQKQTLPWVCFQMLGAICMCQDCFLSLLNLLRARGNLYYFYLPYRRSQLSWSRLQPLHGLLSKSPKLNFPSLTRHHKGSFPYLLGLNTLSPSLSSN